MTRTVTVVEHHTREVPAPEPKNPDEYVRLLNGLAAKLDRGAIYDREIPKVVGAINEVVEAVERRQKATRRALW